MTTPSNRSLVQSDIWHDYIFGQIMVEDTISKIDLKLQDLQKRIAKLKLIGAFLELQSKDFAQINSFVSGVTRFKDFRDDLATIHIKTDKFYVFQICVNQHSDLQIQKIACRVHNLTPLRRKSLVSTLCKQTGPDVSVKNAQIIHRVKNFKIGKS